MKSALFAAVAGGLFALSAAAAAAPPPVIAFARLPALQSAALSPDGQAVAILGGTPDHRQLSIAVIDNPNSTIVNLGNVRASNVRWAGNGYILVEVTAYEKPSWSKYAYNFTRDIVLTRDGKSKSFLLNNSPESGLLPEMTIYKLVPGDKPFVIMNGLDGGFDTADLNTHFKESHDTIKAAIYKVDVATGHGAVVQRGDALDWAFDLSGDARGKVEDTSLGNVISARGKGQAGWKMLATSKESITLYGYSDSEDAVYWSMEDGEAGAAQLRKTSFPGGETKLMAEAPPNAGLRLDPYTGAPLEIVADNAPEHWLDTGLQSASTALAHAFKGKSVELVSWSQDRTRTIIRVSSGDAPASWYLYDQPRKSVSVLGDEYPELKDAGLGKKTFIHYAAADGLDIPAYLHLPAGGAGKNLPLILLPHGGPQSRDDEDFDIWAQFLASRGYVVLQPEFRGSDGFGSKLREAGAHEWGGKMQTDLVDGVSYLAKQGTIDPKRVCIMGLSYGGYAALEGLAAHGDVFRCGISINGLSDLGQDILQKNRKFFHGDENETDNWRSGMLQYFGSSAGSISAASPALHVDKIAGPLLIIYSANDTTVDPAQSREMADHLTSAGKPATVVELPGDDHQLRTTASRSAVFTAVDAFLAKNLPVSP